ncbi:uncharacterized protein [Atheta coriaria]|uniref:uncharacterized protein isoform X3 n=1 Tax=Dalotia coriaria TaxID=877792 RepID=UPI0031F42B7D
MITCNTYIADAELFLQNGGNHYTYLETIQEETSDDLQSDSDFSDSRASPAGWLATDSESGSVIRIQTIDDAECESDREVACPAKRRRQEVLLSDDESSISRSSSLLQFESLEKQCQDISSSSPSIFSNFSYDSLERKGGRGNVSPDSLERGAHSDDDSAEYYKALKIDLLPKKKRQSHDSLLYDNSANCSSGSDSADSEETLEAARYDSSKSVNLKTWRSFDGLHSNGAKTVKISSENLSEDSGYSDNFYNSKMKSSSIPNMMINHHQSTTNKNIYKTRVEIRSQDDALEKYRLKIADRFAAYDGDVFQTFTGNFGVSYHDLSNVDQYEHRSPLIERFMRNGKRRNITTVVDEAVGVNLDQVTCAETECGNFSPLATATSVPNLTGSGNADDAPCVVSSVPKDLNLAGGITSTVNFNTSASIATINCDISTLSSLDSTDSGHSEDFTMPKLSRYQRAEYGDKITIRLKYDTSSISSASDMEATSSFRREGSYLEAMTNSIDMSDEEIKNKKLKDKGMTIYKFDRENALKAISETSIQSFGVKSIEQLNLVASTPMNNINNRNVISTPNLADLDYQYPPRKSSLINRSISTNEIQQKNDENDKNLVKSLSNSTKGVHFSPVISEVNWRDDSASITTEHEDSSCSTTPDRDVQGPVVPPRKLFTRSQPELTLRQRVLVSDDSTDDNEGMKPAVSEELVRRRYQHHQLPHDVIAKRRSVEVPMRENTSEHCEAPTTPAQHEERYSKVKLTGSVQAVPAMEPVGVVQPKSNTRGIGGFFSRIASFRFSTRAAKNQDEKKKQRQTTSLKESGVNNKLQFQSTTGQRLATKDDYIYIPLKGPEVITTTTNTSTPVVGLGVQENVKFSKVQVDGVGVEIVDKLSAKPPLPKMPPRVVGACVKRTGGGAQVPRERIDVGRGRPMEPMGLIETDLDTEVTVITSGHGHAKTRSLMNLGHEPPTTNNNAAAAAAAPLRAPNKHLQQHRQGRPHKSMEFLLDKQNLKVVEPPENELQKGGERVMSEHEIRVQRSLQKLNVPDWYKQAAVPREGFLLRSNKSTHGGGKECRWAGTGSKTTSLSSLGSATQSPVLLSPSALHSQPFVRWSTSKLNSTASSPCASTRSSFNARCQPNGAVSPSSASLRGSFNYRQPYLGWRSQERLARPRTPAERLASTILGQSTPPHAQQPQESPEIQTSIKEVTSAIVHYVSGLRPESGGREHSYDSQETASQRSRSASPRGSQKLCWLESSFVGTRPLDSPQTPLTLTESPTQMNHTPVPPTTLRLDLQTHNDSNALSTAGSRRPSPSSTTLEDVLDSLLGLPSSTRAPSPSLQGTASANTSPIRRQGEHQRAAEQFRRRSEGSEPASRPSSDSRRASLHASPILRCRNSRCGRSASPRSSEAAQFKNCHNCSYTYCSRGCRREHWEKHRKTCLFSRVGTLCRQVIAAAKEQEDTLRTLSAIARRGYLSQGQGAVKIFFPCPEAAEKFLGNGLGSLGDPTYVRWADLLPSEMGPALYAELVKMCKNYNPDSRLVLYVSVCVVSEAPAAGAVKWERQLVSRCGKLRLSRDVRVPDREVENPEAIILTSKPLREEPIQRLREISFQNIQRHLQQRGVSLKRQYPDIYQQLSSYVEGKKNKFTPVTVYPKDTNTGKPFMCIIMPDVEPECLEKVTTAGVRVRTVDVLDDEFILDNT